jgi:hypothetical protein
MALLDWGVARGLGVGRLELSEQQTGLLNQAEQVVLGERAVELL